MKKLGIHTPRGNNPAEKAAISRNFSKFGELAEKFAKNPNNYKIMHVGPKTLKTLKSDHYDRFHTLYSTPARTTVLMRKTPGEEPRIIKGVLTLTNSKKGTVRKILPVQRGDNLIDSVRRAMDQLGPGEFVQIQVGDRTPIYKTLRSMDEFDKYFSYSEDLIGDDEGVDGFGNYISPMAGGWEYPETRPSDYLSVVQLYDPRTLENFGDEQTGNKAKKKKRPRDSRGRFRNGPV